MEEDSLQEESGFEDDLDEEEHDEIEDEETGTSPEQDRKRKLRGFFVEALIYIAIIVLCVKVVPRYVIQRTIVDGDSMMNTLIDQENLLVEKVSYHFKNPERFDVIVFYPYGRDNEEYYIKRVIGLPGETVQIIGSDIYINGEVLEENFGKDPIHRAGIVEEPQTVGDDEFFVLGDNREVSQDSRYEEVGFVKKKNIEGKAVLRIFPFSKFGTFQ
ncbi:MAG: signal peptidase I [Lachnospiraceae bacterium]|nr:signal peptidase I [Lachnospiraceae bacterium]